MNDIKNVVKNGGIIVFPTDTVYGVGVYPKREYLDKLYVLKNRDKDKKIVALVSSKEKAKEILDEDMLAYKIVDNLFPGEITLIAKASKKYIDIIGYDYIGVRMPNSVKAIEILQSCEGVVMTTSANLSGEKTPTKFNDIPKQILDNVDFAIEDDSDLSGLSSSIFKLQNGEITLLREGNISLDEVIKLKED